MKPYLLFSTLLFILCCQVYNRPHTPVENISSDSVEIGKISLLTNNGGRVAWYKGAKHELIAYDAIVDRRSANTEIFLIEPDGSGQICVTCNSDIPKGFIAQMEWHPDGEHLVLQAENEFSKHNRYNHGAWGINQDLWIVRKDGTNAEKIYAPVKNGAALHPHFSQDGKKIIFAERVPTGRVIPRLRNVTPGGENNWNGWQIHIADFDISKKGTNKLSHHKTMQPNGTGMYETHGFSPDNQILFSHTAHGQPYVDDIYAADVDGSKAINLTNSPKTWDEHGLYQPAGKTFAFMSSRYNPKLIYPQAGVLNLVTELYKKEENGDIIRISNMNERLGYECIISDFEWDRSGKRIVFQVATFKQVKAPQIWMLEME